MDLKLDNTKERGTIRNIVTLDNSPIFLLTKEMERLEAQRFIPVITPVSVSLIHWNCQKHKFHLFVVSRRVSVKQKQTRQEERKLRLYRTSSIVNRTGQAAHKPMNEVTGTYSASQIPFHITRILRSISNTWQLIDTSLS